MKNLFAACWLFIFSSTAALAQAVLPAVWNFSNPNISNPPAGWTLGLGTNGNLTYAFGIGDNLSARLDATGEFMTLQFAQKPGELSYWLSPQNAGNAWGGQFDIQESADGSNWSTLRSITTKASTSTNFTGGRYVENLNANTRFVRFYYTTKLPGGSAGGGNMAVDSVMVKQAPAPATPTIEVSKNGVTLLSGSSLVVGTTAITGLSIFNKGTQQTLRIDSAYFTGPAASDYSVTNLPDTVAANTTRNFNLNLNASAIGSRLATLHIRSNDVERTVYSINLYGIGGSYATEPGSNNASLSSSQVSSYGFNLQLTGDPSAEHILVLIKRGAAVTEQPTDGITYKKGDYIGGAQVAFIGDSSALIKPTYILANQTYHFAAFTFNGPAGFENYKTSGPATHNLTTSGRTPGNYYSGINPANSNFVSSLSARINPHDTIFYSNYISRMVNPWLTRDTSGGRKVVTCVYTGHQFVYDEPFLWAAGNNGAVLTREHTWPQSWMPSNQGNPNWPNAPGTNRELPEYNDLHNLFPAHQLNANGRRSNNPFHEVVTPTYTSPTGVGVLGLDSFNVTSYEPRPEHKGDVARALYYMAVCYNGISGNSWAIPSQQKLNILKQWHEQDPPDNFEIARNEYVAVTQGNRNPFVDFPEWVNRINFSNMSYIPGDTTPPPVKQITIIKPTGADTWKKGDTALIHITWQQVDSVWVLFSQDSGKTYQPLFASNLSVNNFPFKFIPASNFSGTYGKLIIKDAASATSDTSDIFTLDNGVGISHAELEKMVNLFPNPTESNFKIESQGLEFTHVKVYASDGRKVVDSLEHTIQIENNPSGIYLVEIVFKEGVVWKKLIKQ